MSCRLLNKTYREVIKIKNLPLGRIGIIVGDSEDAGKLVVKYKEGELFMVLGCSNTDKWFFPGADIDVRILQDGEIIEVQNS